jgi:hypothetical protein
MSWTQTDLDRLEAAIAKGVRSVTYQSGSVTYASTAEMFQIRDAMQIALGVSQGVSRSAGAYNNGLSGPGCTNGWWPR